MQHARACMGYTMQGACLRMPRIADRYLLLSTLWPSRSAYLSPAL